MAPIRPHVYFEENDVWYTEPLTVTSTTTGWDVDWDTGTTTNAAWSYCKIPEVKRSWTIAYRDATTARTNWTQYTKASARVVWTNWTRTLANTTLEVDASTISRVIRAESARVMARERERREFQAMSDDVMARERERREFQALSDGAMSAAQKAVDLLVQHLDEEQRTEYNEHRHFHVRSRLHHGRSYRIERGTMANVLVLEDGQPTHRLCAHPVGVPDGDSHLAQLFALETDEAAFLEVANRHHVNIR